MKVVVTGATGYLGGRLCRALLAHGHSVRAVVRRTSDLSSLRPTDFDGEGCIEVVYGDVTDYQSLLAAFSGCDVLFHSAAMVETWLPDPSLFYTVNVDGLKNVLKAVEETNTIKKIIYTSSFFALGSTDGRVGDENQIHREERFCTEYERSKAVADKIVLNAANAGGMPIVAVYPGVIYGPGKLTAGNMVAKLLVEFFSGRLPGYIGNGGDRFSFCHVDDVVEGHTAAMEKGRAGERYLLTGENASFKQLLDTACFISGKKKPWLRIPLVILEAYGYLLTVVSRITGRLPTISPPAVRVLRYEWAYSCEKARQELGYEPRSLRDGLGEVLPWLNDLKLIKY